jgi:hypothetical protein
MKRSECVTQTKRAAQLRQLKKETGERPSKLEDQSLSHERKYITMSILSTSSLLQHGWNDLQSVPSYVEQQATLFAQEPTWCEDDVTAHVEDTPLFWVPRNGRPVQLSWNSMTDDERLAQREADRRAAYIAQFDPCALA